MPKCITLLDLQRYDAKNQTSLVREIEMKLHAIKIGLYAIQFFKDCELYGFREAKTYLLNYVSSAKIAKENEVADFCETLDRVLTEIGE